MNEKKLVLNPTDPNQATQILKKIIGSERITLTGKEFITVYTCLDTIEKAVNGLGKTEV